MGFFYKTDVLSGILKQLSSSLILYFCFWCCVGDRNNSFLERQYCEVKNIN